MQLATKTWLEENDQYDLLLRYAKSQDSFVAQICSDHLTQETNRCCLADPTKSTYCHFKRKCQQNEVIQCAGNEDRLYEFLKMVLKPERCEIMTPVTVKFILLRLISKPFFIRKYITKVKLPVW